MKVFSFIFGLLFVVLTTSEKCEKGKNYDTDGQTCVVWGDPHFTMFNGGQHDYMGKLDMRTKGQGKGKGKGRYKDSYYYVARCDRDQTKKEMPIQILGTHFYNSKAQFDKNDVWNANEGVGGGVTLLDYVTIEIIGTDNKMYYVFFSSQFVSYVRKSCKGADINYDRTLKAVSARSITTIPRSGNTEIGGFIFKMSGNTMKIVVPIEAAKEEDRTVTITMTGHKNSYYGPRRKQRIRYWQHCSITMPKELKCKTCGLCGQFSSPKGNKQMVKECDGHWLAVRDGHTVSEAYDPDGWTFEYNWFNKKCGKKHPIIKKEIDGESYKCQGWKKTEVDKECDRALNTPRCKKACSELDKEECEHMKASCYVDACFDSADTVQSVKQEADNTAQDIIEEANANQGYYAAAQGEVVKVDDMEQDDDVVDDGDEDMEQVYDDEEVNDGNDDDAQFIDDDDEVDDDMFDDGNDDDAQFIDDEEQQVNDDDQVDDDDMFYDEEQVNDDDDAQYIDDDEPQNEEYGAYDNDDYEQQPKYIPYYVPVQQPVAPSMFTLDNIFMASLVVMVISMTVSITLCCMRRSSTKQIASKYTAVRTFNDDEDVEFVN